MPKPLPTTQNAVKLLARRIAENKEGFKASQLHIMLAALDRLAAMNGAYEVGLAPPQTPYDRTPAGVIVKEEDESRPEHPPTLTWQEAVALGNPKSGGDNGTSDDTRAAGLHEGVSS